VAVTIIDDVIETLATLQMAVPAPVRFTVSPRAPSWRVRDDAGFAFQCDGG
jgi:hypothetical protein